MRDRSTLIAGKFAVVILVFFVVVSMGSNAIAGPPTFSIAFSPSTIGPGAISTITYTIDNSAESTPVSGLTFSNTLPTGVTIANPSSASTSCINGSFSATAGGDAITFSDYRLGKQSACTFSIDVTSSTPGTHVNTTGALSTSEGSAGTANANLTVDSGRPGFSKSFSPSSITPGGVSTLTFTIDNSLNGSTANLLRFTDTLPTGLVVSNSPNSSTNCSGGIGTPVITATPGTDLISLTTGSAIAGTSCTVSVDVTAAATGNYLNISGDLSQNGSNPSGTARALLTVTNPFLFKSFPTSNSPGTSVKLSYTMTNLDRSNTATGITFTDDLNAALSGLAATVLPANGFCGAGSTLSGSSTLTIAGASLDSGESCTFEVTVLIPANAAAGSYTSTTSTVNLTLGSPTTKPAVSSELVVKKAPVVTATFIDDPVSAGEDVTLRYVITNTDSANAATAITFTETVNDVFAGMVIKTLPSANSCGSGSTFTSTQVNETLSISVSGANLAAGGDCTFDVILTAPEDGTPGTYAYSTSTISSTVSGATVYSSAATDNLVVVAAPSITASIVEDHTNPDTTVTLQFELTYSANATSDATSIAFSDDINAMLSGAVSTTAQQNNICGTGSQLSGTSNLSFTGGTLAPGGSCSFSVTLQIPSGATPGVVTNTTSAVSAVVSSKSVSSAAASDTLTISGLTFSKTFIDPIFAGETVTIRYTITNAASALAATAMQFTDSLSSVVSSMAATSLPSTPCGPGSTLTGTTSLSFSGGTLQPGESCTFDVLASIPAGTSVGSFNSASSSMSATVNGNNTVNPSASDVLDVTEPQLLLSKSFTDDPVLPGETVTLNFTIENLETGGTWTNLSFTDDLDAVLPGLTAIGLPQSDVCGSGSQITGTDVISFTGGSVPSQSSCSFNVTVNVPTDTAINQYTNTTSDLTGKFNGGSDLTGNKATDTLQIQPLAFSKSFLNDAIQGGTTKLEFSILNKDKVNRADNIGFSDDLNAMIPNLVASGLPVNDVCGSGSVLSGTSEITLSDGSLSSEEGCTFTVILQVPAETAVGNYLNTTSLVKATFNDVQTPSSAASATLAVSQGVAWVDSSFSGIEKGTEDEPFNTLAEALNEVSSGGLLIIKAGISSEKPTILKKVILTSDGGAAIIGVD